jgi:hypothetical protein
MPMEHKCGAFVLAHEHIERVPWQTARYAEPSAAENDVYMRIQLCYDGPLTAATFARQTSLIGNLQIAVACQSQG